MPKFARFYSATEAEALANISQFLSQETERALLSNDDAAQLASIINGTTTSTFRPRNDVNQPLFRPILAVQSVEQLLNVSGFSVSHETVHRDKPVHYASPSEDAAEWKTRSRTPSSDEPSPRKYDIPSPTLSVKAEASSTSEDASDDGLAHAAGPTTQQRQYNWGQYPDYYATYQQDVLQSMDMQFSKWSYDHNEGTTAIPFVMAQAPAETHARVVEADRELWAADTEDSMIEITNTEDTAQAAILESLQKNRPRRPTPSKGAMRVQNDSLDKKSVSREEKSMSKRAALIAKSKATKDSSLVASKSLGQRRSAMQKNKNRRSIMPSPPPTVRKPGPVRKPESQAEQSRPTILILNQNEDDPRRDVDSALQNRRLDFDNRQQLEELMNKLGNAITNKDKTNESRVVEEVGEGGLDRNVVEQASKAHRLKGKARKKSNIGAAQ